MINCKTCQFFRDDGDLEWCKMLNFGEDYNVCRYYKPAMADNRRWNGYFDIKVYRGGALLQRDIVKNTIMDAALNAEIEILLGNAPDLEIKYMAFGSGNTAVTTTDTVLDDEEKRIVPTTAFARTATGQTEGMFYLTASDLVGVTIEEIGIFCGSGATSSADTGTLLSRALWHFEKTANDEIEITRVDKVERG